MMFMYLIQCCFCVHDRWKRKPIKHMKNIFCTPSALLWSHKQHNKQQAINLKYLSVRFWEIAVLLCVCCSVYRWRWRTNEIDWDESGENAMQFHCRWCSMLRRRDKISTLLAKKFLTDEISFPNELYWAEVGANVVIERERWCER